MAMGTAESPGNKKRKRYSKEFKQEAVRLVESTGKTKAEVERDLGLPRNSLSLWVKQARIDAGEGLAGALTTDEKSELGRLRKQVRDLEMERALLKKWVAYCAKENG